MAIIAIDVDDVCLNLTENWLRIYNQDFNDNLQKKHITSWNIQKFVKEKARKRIFEYIEDDTLFLGSPPIEGALETIKWIKKSHRVIYVTANDPKNCKFTWLLQNGFIEHIDDLIVAYDKDLIISDILLDDRFKNVRYRKGGWLLTQPWNARYEFKNRVNNWLQFKTLFENGEII